MKLLSKFFFSVAISTFALSSFSAKETVMYKKVDENGKIIFTDKPIPGSKPISVNTEVNVIKRPKSSVREKPKNIDESLTPPTADSGLASDNMPDSPFQYDVLSVDAPQANQKLATGDFTVIAGITPQLRPEHSLKVVIDGSEFGEAQKIPYFAIQGIGSGRHNIQVSVVDDNSGDIVQTSDKVLFIVQ